MVELEKGKDMLTENEVKKRMNQIYNGGPGSGNPNPGQGRGKGKPGAGAGSGNSDPISVPMSKRKRIEFEDDIVAVYRDDEEIYKGMEDDEPMKREPWKYDDSTKTYSIPGYEEYKKVCIDI